MEEHELIAVMQTYLVGQGFSHERLGDAPAFDFEIPGRRAALPSYLAVDAPAQQLVYYTVFPFSIPAERRGAVAELLTRSNYELVLGNFEMDVDDGEIRFRSGLSFRGIPLSPVMIHNAIAPAVGSMERFIPGIINVMQGKDSPAEAIEKILG